MKNNLLILLGVLCVLNMSAQVKIDVQRYTDLFNRGEYRTVFNECYELRNKQEFAKNYVLDYFISKSLCANGNYSDGGRGFKYILNEYPLTPNQKDFIMDEFGSCQRSEAVAAPGEHLLQVDFKMVSGPNVPRARVSGKLGYILDCKADTAAYKFMPEFDRLELQKRLFDIENGDDALAYYKNFLGKNYAVSASGRFIFITQKPYSLSDAQLKNAGTKLEKAYHFFHTFYGIRPPDKLITIYLMRTKNALQAVAARVHGIKLPQNNIGYSGLEDLSLLGNSDAENTGTIYHELFHLMIRTDLGDIPAWLDEGIACLYETSAWNRDKLKGDIINWRTDVLRESLKAGHSLPHLNKLISQNWDGFILGDKTTPCDIALHYAVAKHFAIYMQEKDLLQKMVAAFKDRKNVFTDTLSKNETSESLVEQAAGMPIAALQKEFDGWLEQKYNLKTTPSQGRSLESRFRTAYELLNTYRNSVKSEVVNSAFQKLQSDYLKIAAGIKESMNSNVMNSVNQVSALANLPAGLSGQMEKFITEVSMFMEKNPH